jgi:transposase
MFDNKNINRARGPKEGSLMNRKMVDYIVKGKEVFVGLEDSKRTWKVSVRSEGREIHYVSMQARYSILHEYLCRKYPECSISVIYEAGFKGFGLHDLLIKDEIECIVTPPSKVTQEKCNRVKTDKIDARRLATVLEKGDFKACSVPDIELREDRQLCRAMVQVQGEITRTKNRIRKFFDFHGYAEVFAAGAWNEKQYKEARDVPLSEPLKLTLQYYFEFLDKLKEIRKKLHRNIMALCKKERYKESVRIISSIAGVGKLTAIRLVLEWGDTIATRFRSGNSLACFAGLTQSEYSTGDTVHRGRITGQGRGYIRASLVQCAWMNIKRDPAMLKAFNRIAKNTGSKKKAIVAIARKLVVRMWTCLHLNTEYVVGVLE